MVSTTHVNSEGNLTFCIVVFICNFFFTGLLHVRAAHVSGRAGRYRRVCRGGLHGREGDEKVRRFAQRKLRSNYQGRQRQGEDSGRL